MPEAFAEALGYPGFVWLVGALFVAGLVRGFSGFGTALIYVPIAAQILPPVWVLVTVTVCDVLGPLFIARRAVRDAYLPDLQWILGGVLVGVPIGLAILLTISPETFGLVAAIVTLVMLVCLMGGFRYRGTLSSFGLFGIGVTGGTLGGASGVPGPPVILFYLASGRAAREVRANTLLYLLGFDAIMIAILLVSGRVELLPFVMGIMLSIPNALGNLCGAALFQPGYERAYRHAAFAIIGASALSALPIW